MSMKTWLLMVKVAKTVVRSRKPARRRKKTTLRVVRSGLEDHYALLCAAGY
jgi:hypothetical protein